MTDGQNWRAIMCRDIDWTTALGKCRASMAVGYNCNPHFVRDDPRWSAMTLGELADIGPRQWRRGYHIGEKAIALIMLTIDMAAAGRDVTRRADAYVPRPLFDEGAA